MIVIDFNSVLGPVVEDKCVDSRCQADGATESSNASSGPMEVDKDKLEKVRQWA